MAQMIPDQLPGKASKGEERLFALLKRLPDDCIVYYEAIIQNRYPDFIVLIPTVGILIIEVKGWFVKDIRSITPEKVNVDGVIKQHPARQAREYMFNLMDTCKKSPFAAFLLHRSGKRLGNLAFPFAAMVVLSNIERTEVENAPLGNLSLFFPQSSTMTKDELMVLGSKEYTDDQWIGVFKEYFPINMRWPVFMTARQINALRAIIHPEIAIVAPPYAESAENPLPVTLEVTKNFFALKILDMKQDCEARCIGSGHRLIWGVAGSGKTVMLVSRARILATNNPNAKILVTCFNIALAAYLKECLHDYPAVEVMYFHEVIRKHWGLSMIKDEKAASSETPEQFGNRVLKKIADEPLPIDSKYDMILIDEAQDFDPSWIQCLLEMLKDRYNGDFVIVGDGMQGIYKTRKITWKSLGIQAQGRTTYFRVNYRNSTEIIQVAYRFSPDALQTQEEGGIVDVRLEPDKSFRSTGFKPILLERQHFDALIYDITIIVKNLLEGTFNGKKLEAPLRPGEIAVLYPALTRRLRENVSKLYDSLSSVTKVQWLQKGKQKLQSRSPELKLLTIHSAKGLQYKAVILFGAEALPIIPPNATSEEKAEAVMGGQKLAYVALTRAEDILVVGYTQTSSFVDKLREIAADGFMDLSAE